MRQLIFTSAVSGLSGRSGFCTVARHASLRERIVAELERMSEYEPPAGTRPTVFLFRVYSGGIEPLYILSRLSDAGTDAFGRPNHVAHHLVFRGNELEKLPPPAEVALRFSGWCGKYAGAPRFFDENESLPPEILRKPGECFLPAKRWEALTGDAGNAALLCPHGDARATVFVGDDSMTETVLGLFAESAETLGAELAWEVAFSTGICSEKNRGRFLWRMVAARELAVRAPGDFILDFLAPLALLRAPKTEFAEFARTGIFKKTPRSANVPAENFSGEISAGISETVPAEEKSSDEKNPVPAENAPAKISSARKKFSELAGTAKFLGLAALLVVAVLAGVIFFEFPEKIESSATERATEIPRSDEPAAVFCEMIEERIATGDIVGAAEIWLAFSETFPQAAESRKSVLVPRFKLKVADAYAEKLARRLKATEFGGTLSDEEKRLVAADLAMFRKICRALDLSPGRIQRKNLLIIERAGTLVGEASREN